jgi:KDO2-lipid IV(A) lauroyltransferase
VSPREARFDHHLLEPRHWPTWSALAVFRTLSLLPYTWQLALGRALGRLTGRWSQFRRHVVRANLALCLPELSDRERMDLERRVFESFGMGLVEEAMAFWLPTERLRALGRIEGEANLRAALAPGKGVILLACHMTSLEVCGRLACLFLPDVAAAFSYRENKNPVLDSVLRRAREHHCGGAAPRSDPRAMVRYLKANRMLWFAPDQDYGRKHSVFVPFFGVPAATITTLSRIARLSGAAVVPFQNQRLPQGRGYLLRFAPALENFPSRDDTQDALRVNQVIERWIRETPEQYLWTHRRFKTRPPGHLKLYLPKRGGTRRRPGEPA